MGYIKQKEQNKKNEGLILNLTRIQADTLLYATVAYKKKLEALRKRVEADGQEEAAKKIDGGILMLATLSERLL